MSSLHASLWSRRSVTAHRNPSLRSAHSSPRSNPAPSEASLLVGNFDFAKTTLPTVHTDCARAESYLTTDPRSACFYSRRAVEELVGHLYDVLALPVPYKDDLAARTNDAGFKAVTGNGINQKLNLIRKLGNTAVHDTKPIPAHAALSVLRELHHVVVWAAFRYSPTPQAVPTQAQFDPALAAKAAPLSREELVKLAAKFKAQDEAHAQGSGREG